MKKITIFTVLFLTGILFGTSCHKEENNLPFEIEGIALDNFPYIDGSTSTDPLVQLIAWK